MSVYKKLYEDYNYKSERVDNSLEALQELYNIPQDVVDQHRKFQWEAENAWTIYWNALCEPIWTKIWRTLIRK